jgi:hypothetical protein
VADDSISRERGYIDGMGKLGSGIANDVANGQANEWDGTADPTDQTVGGDAEG